jgi:hypothetical protein
MNVKKVIASIERNHAVMQAHVQRLTTISPEPKLPQPVIEAEHSPSSNASALLNASVIGHLQGAANAMLAMAEVESHFDSTIGSDRPDVPHSVEIIDVEASSIETKEEAL